MTHAAFLTAYQALHVINELKKDEDVLIHAGASGVGVAAIQLAKVLGARHVYVTAGSQEKLDFCTSLGATDGFNYKEGSWKDKLQHATNKEGVDVIMDFIGAPYFADNLASLKRDGRLSMQGFLGGAVVKEANLGPILTKRLRIEGSTLRNRSLEYQAKLVQDFFHTGGLDKIVDGKHRLVVHAVYDWKDIAAAHDSIEANHSTSCLLTRHRQEYVRRLHSRQSSPPSRSRMRWYYNTIHYPENSVRSETEGTGTVSLVTLPESRLLEYRSWIVSNTWSRRAIASENASTAEPACSVG